MSVFQWLSTLYEASVVGFYKSTESNKQKQLRYLTSDQFIEQDEFNDFS